MDPPAPTHDLALTSDQPTTDVQESSLEDESESLNATLTTLS